MPADVAALVARARTLVHAVRADRLLQRLEYHVYRVAVDTASGELEGDLVQVRPTPRSDPASSRDRCPSRSITWRCSTRTANRSRPRSRCRSSTTRRSLLRCSPTASRTALLIPAAPLATDTYRFAWTIDRRRYRAVVVDGTTNYRASVITAVPIRGAG